ncbi:MAG: minor capsid protein, partial [Methanobacterium sp.]
LILLAVIPAFERERIEIMVKEAAKSYLKGTEKAYSKLGEKFVSDEIKKEVEEYLAEYKAGLLDGYTVIQEKKVYWLRDRTLAERQNIFDIIKKGTADGNNAKTITQKLQDYFNMQKSQAERIAVNETAYVQARARDSTYQKYGVEKVLWVVGSNPCHICEELAGQVFTWDDLPYQQPVHVRCNCELEPVFN